MLALRNTWYVQVVFFSWHCPFKKIVKKRHCAFVILLVKPHIPRKLGSDSPDVRGISCTVYPGEDECSSTVLYSTDSPDVRGISCTVYPGEDEYSSTVLYTVQIPQISGGYPTVYPREDECSSTVLYRFPRCRGNILQYTPGRMNALVLYCTVYSIDDWKPWRRHFYRILNKTKLTKLDFLSRRI